jgi:AraC-like DNA-binding protein
MPEGPIRHRRRFAAADDLHLRVLVAGWSEIGAWWHGKTVDQAFWRLYLNDGDGAELSLPDGRTMALAPGRVWLLPAGLNYSNRTRRRLGHMWIHFDLIGLSPGGLRGIASAPIAVPLDDAARGLAAAVRTAALDEAVSDLELRCLAKAQVHLALARWWKGLAEGVRGKLLLAVADPDLAPALARVESDLAAPLYNQALARGCGLSPSTFVRRFRAAIGMSPAQYVLERRIATAAERLLTGTYGIEAISEALGFSDRFYFTRVFTRRMGCSPAAYRDNRAGTRGAPVRAGNG